jgi:hypothetical protein
MQGREKVRFFLKLLAKIEGEYFCVNGYNGVNKASISVLQTGYNGQICVSSFSNIFLPLVSKVVERFHLFSSELLVWLLG